MTRESVSGKRIALIGGGGFIGHNLALELVRQGARVEIVDSLQVNNLLWFASGFAPSPDRTLYLQILHERLSLLHQAGIPLHPMDARDYHALSRALGEIQPEVVIHLAAVSHAGRSNKDPYSTFDHSLRTLENALDFSRGAGVRQFIFFSSSMVYGNFQAEEVEETHPLEPIGIYGALKVAGEKLVIAYNQVFDLPYTIVRPSALYGPRCVSRRVTQIFIENALGGAPLRVEGDGREKLDFTYIDDLVAGVSQAIGHPKGINQIFNLTRGEGRSIQSLAEILKGHFPGLRVESTDRDRLMPVRGTLSIRKAKERIGFDPQVSLEEGCRRYVQWYQQLQEPTQTPARI